MNVSNLEEENRLLKAKLNKYEIRKKEKWNKRVRLSKNISNKFLGVRLKDAITNFFTELEEKRSVTKETVSDLLAALFMRITRIGFFLVITSLLPTLLILLQVYFLGNQNKLINNQNNRLDQQTYLQEAERRSSMIMVLDQMIREVTKNGANTGHISKPSSARLIALSKLLKPYKYLENDKLIENPLSPERGYLLLSLAESELNLKTIVNKNTRESLISLLDFNYAELKNASITNLDLNNTELNFSNLSHSKLIKSTLKGCDFIKANLEFINFNNGDILNCNFKDATLKGARFINSELKKLNFENADLTNVNFNGSELTDISFKNASIIGAKFNKTKVDSTFMQTMKEMLSSDNFDYLEDTYKLKINKGVGILVTK